MSCTHRHADSDVTDAELTNPVDRGDSDTRVLGSDALDIAADVKEAYAGRLVLQVTALHLRGILDEHGLPAPSSESS